MSPTTAIAEFERALVALAGEPTAASQPVEVGALWAFTGVEVALARAVVPVRSLGRVWRDRRGLRATPLLLVAPGETEGRIAVVGPAAAEPVREVDPERLAIEVARLRAETAIRAGRALNEILDTLAGAVVPGVEVRGLLTDHFVRTRLPRDAQKVEALKAAATPAVGKHDWREALQALGYTIADRGKDGWIARDGQRSVALIHAKREPSEFARMDEAGRLPEGKLISECQDQKYPWGIMASGSRIRLFQAETGRGAATERWIDLDLRVLDESQYLVGLLAPAALSEGGLWPVLIDESLKFGAALKERLDAQIRQYALPNIARGLGEWMERQRKGSIDDPEVRGNIQRATYTLLFRLLFLMYAESAGHLSGAGYERIGLRGLCSEARAGRGRFDSRSHTLWGRLQNLTRAIREGDTRVALPQYNGSLFAADDLPGADILEAAEVSDALIGPALDALGFNYEAADDVGLDYTDLDIAHLGGIYEGLLALRLSRADQTYAWQQKDDRFVPSDEPGDYGVEVGQLFFQTESGGRKGGGVYYTRQELVRHLVSHSVLPALDEHLDRVKRVADADTEAATLLLFRFRVLDPAMGSGHFLVDALDVIAERVQRFLADVSLPPLRRRLDLLKSEAGTNAAEDGKLLKRLLLKHCVYGVDLQEMAVELARVALWLSAFVPGLTLSYLDQNLKRGNSLLGVSSLDVVLAGGGSRTWGRRGGALDTAFAAASEIANEIAYLGDRNKEEVERSRTLREHLDKHLEGIRSALDLWTAEPFGVAGARLWFGGAGEEEVVSGQVRDRRAQRLLDQSREIAREHSFFHWPLEFPAVFSNAQERSPGFSAVIGNPPFLNQLETLTSAGRSDAALFKDLFQGVVKNYSDIASLFLIRAVELACSDRGQIALVQPESIVSTRDSKEIRQKVSELAAFTSVWVALEKMFDDADVMTCGLNLVKGGARLAQVTRFKGARFVALPTKEVVMDDLVASGAWGPLVADAVGVPSVAIQSVTTLGDFCSATADFRDQYYGLAPYVEEAGLEGMSATRVPLVTVGLISTLHCDWGVRSTRFNKTAYQAPVVDMARLEAGAPTLFRWAQSRLVPKLLVATQTKVIEVVVDEVGTLLPSVPVISVTPHTGAVWRLAAALSSPVLAAWSLQQYFGAALTSDAIKLSAKQIESLPAPTDVLAWDAAAALAERVANTTDPTERLRLLREFAVTSSSAYGITDLGMVDWWLGRLPKERTLTKPSKAVK